MPKYCYIGASLPKPYYMFSSFPFCFSITSSQPETKPLREVKFSDVTTGMSVVLSTQYLISNVTIID